MHDRHDRRRAPDPALLLLVSLASGPKHGHAMLLDVASFSGERLGPGTLYGALQRLEEDELIEALPGEERRVPYRLTDAGRRHLAGRLDALGTVVRVGTERVAT